MVAAKKSRKPQVGYLALHKNNQLDARPVTRVEGSQIWIDIWGLEAGPLPASNYTYTAPPERPLAV